MAKTYKNYGLYSKYDIGLAKLFVPLKRECQQISAQIKDVVSFASETDFGATEAELTRLHDNLVDVLKQIHALTPFNYTKFSRYANCLFENTVNTVIKNPFLLDCVQHFDNLQLSTKQLFGQILFSQMANLYNQDHGNATSLFFIANDNPAVKAYYDSKHTIVFQQRVCTENCDIENFIQMFAHEFSHYLYIQCPNKTDVNAQQAYIIKYGYIYELEGEEYCQQPFERPSYEMSLYFKQRNFVQTVVNRLLDKKQK